MFVDHKPVDRGQLRHTAQLDGPHGEPDVHCQTNPLHFDKYKAQKFSDNDMIKKVDAEGELVKRFLNSSKQMMCWYHFQTPLLICYCLTFPDVHKSPNDLLSLSFSLSEVDEICAEIDSQVCCTNTQVHRHRY